ncbi:MAG TPA: CHAT domain-containing tetratricopeptide repeat protein [Stellaceae bacterium]|nr:CHAT domain-containing tetratricopeptide repeat protein [Stellaceae bacterium]
MNPIVNWRRHAAAALLLGASAMSSAALAQTYVPPPRSIADVTALLDSEKPDPAKLASYLAQADAQVPAGASPGALAAFYRDRSVAASQLGRIDQWIADGKEALRLADQINDSNLSDDARNELAQAESQVGNYAAGIEYARQRVATAGAFVGQGVTAHGQLASAYAFAGHLPEARAEAEAAVNGVKTMQQMRRIEPISITNVQRSAVLAVGVVAEVEGRTADAETQYRQALAAAQTVLDGYDGWMNQHKGSKETFQYIVTGMQSRLALVVERQGRLAEAEAIARQTLLDNLHQQGRYAPRTASTVGVLANIVLDEGRADDALRLAQAAVEIFDKIGASRGARISANARLVVGNALLVKGDWKGAMAAYDEAGRGIGPQDQAAGALFNGALGRIIAMLKTGRAAEALDHVSRVAEARLKNLGPSHPATLETQGLRAAALYYSGRKDEALAAFREAVPKLIQTSRVNDSGDSAPILREMQMRFVLETYIGLLSERRDAAAAGEAFALADVIRGQSVQRALAQSAARVSVRDPALADLVRREQDARSQINALFALIANIQAAPADQRDDKAAAALRAQVDQMRGNRAKLREEIEKRFPDYANLIDPKPVTLEQARKVLGAGEAMVTFYLGETRSFVWTVPASGVPAFAGAPLSAVQVAAEVQALRRALEPNASTLAEIPAFDTDRAYRLYAALLQPVESGWRGANSLLVVPHGALGELPLALLPTAPGKPGAAGTLPFAEYQKVPWLIRQVAVTQLPSATSLVTLRTLPAGNASRRAFLGFGDPWFNEAEAKEAQSGAGPGTVIASRGAGGKGLHIVLRAAPKTETARTATVANLPRLPETADEVRNVAIALKADPNADVFLGARANEETVRTVDLGNRRVVMFATHGLVPGDLDGLQEPALALSAPGVAHVQGDGLLTMSKILGLKLDADWVVLSACNTAAGSGAGAEAVSGLGRAFFYAGTRALLVSNWPVETTSARTLTTDLFRRQAEQPGLSRAEALRQAELALIDGPGFSTDGKPLFSYAHPIFWAPFAIIGDGGGSRS